MARTPKRLFGPAQLTNAAATKYTVPSATKTIVRHIHVQNPDAAAHSYTISIGSDAAGTRIYDSFQIPAAGTGVTDSTRDHFPYYVLETTEIIQAFADVSAKLVMTIDGDELTLG